MPQSNDELSFLKTVLSEVQYNIMCTLNKYNKRLIYHNYYSNVSNNKDFQYLCTQVQMEILSTIILTT